MSQRNRNFDEIRRAFDRDGLEGVWRWAVAKDTPLSKARRFADAAHFAGERKQDPRDGDPNWAKAQATYRAQRDRWERRVSAIHDDRWPASLRIAELLYHPPGPHVHVASPDREALIRVLRIAEDRGIRVGEFPPFDPVEDVHVSGSWHYRDSGSPWIGRDFANRGDGLAADLNDLDGGSDQEYAFYLELRRRYA